MSDFLKNTAITFDDVLLVPSKSKVLPKDIEIQTKLTKNIKLNIPILSAAMDTVTESGLAVAIAREGGIGIIHRNMTKEKQIQEVKKVKKSESWIIEDPVVISPDDTIEKAKKLMVENDISGLPVVNEKKLVGIVTNRDLRFKKQKDLKVSEIMTTNLITTHKNTTPEEAVRLLDKHKIEKLLVTDSSGNLKGLITVKDIHKMEKYPNACKDKEGKLMVGAAVGVNEIERVDALVKAGADVLVIDTAHGHSENVIQTVKEIKKTYDIDVIAGNIATKEGAEDLINAGADAVKVGVGPGSICTTRIVAGVGMPQITAIQEASETGDRYGIPVIADGGVRYSGDISKAIAAGASSVMIGSLLAGTEESPGRIVFVGGRKYKSYRGMGSLGAIQSGSVRYGKQENGKLVPEGVEGLVPYRGKVSEMIFQLLGGLRSGMGYCGCKTIEEMRKNAKFVKISKAAIRESHPHDIRITAEAPNYWKEENDII
ncbi:MAG: IMP dehydrogenase [Candidatus Aenigmatarchaeota archaeon]|nr:MAG: IMP dehydrogenase [Candidatus Aenigmarchaeota archaeon]